MKNSAKPISLEPLFLSLGLSEKESNIYRILLDIAQGTAATIIAKSGLKRGITYAVLYSLEKKRLIRQFKKEGKTYFQMESPQKLVELIEKKKKEVEQVEKSLETVIPQLTSQYKLAIGKPTIRYFEGKQGLIEIFKDIYAPKKDPVYGAVDMDQIQKVFPSVPDKEFIPSRLKNKLYVKCLFNDTEYARGLHQKDKEQLRETHLLDPKKYPLPACLEAYEDKVALMSFKKNEFLGLIIQNEDFAITMSSVLRFLFDHLRECESPKPLKSK